MKKLTFESAIGILTGIWFAIGVLLQTLLMLMALDMVTGLLAAYVSKTLSSAVTFRGIVKKAVILCVVVAVFCIARGLGAQYAIDVNLGGWVAAGFCVHEFLSIIENSGKAGVKLPKPLLDALDKLKSKEPANVT